MVARVDEAETLDCQLGAAALADETRLHVNDEGVVEAIGDLVVGEILTIHRHLNRQDVRLGVLRNVDLDLS